MLKDCVDSYLAVRRAAGFTLRVPECLLRSFVRMAAECGDQHVRTDTAIAWAALAPTPRQRERRLNEVIRFARYLRAEDSSHDLPPRGVFAHQTSRRIPYIFSADDIRRLLDAASGLGPRESLRPHTYHALFGLIAATGLRVSEALGLALEDVTEDGLRIRDTKFRKSRLVPLHPTTRAALDEYLAMRRRMGGSCEQMFVSVRGARLAYPTAIATFLLLVRRLGLHPGPGQSGPRIHDLRHTFAVRALEQAPQTKACVAGHLLALSTYLGHAHVADTCWYLQATPQLMSDIADACEHYLRREMP